MSVSKSTRNHITTAAPHQQTHQRSQSLNPSLIPPWRTTSASGHLPTNPLIPPPTPLPNPLASPRSAAPIPSPRANIPPSRYLGHNTCRIFSQTASRSRDNVAHTVSSMVFCGARRSSPGMEDVRKEPVMLGRDEEEDAMFPVRGVRSVVGSLLWAGLSASMAVRGEGFG